jgi:hypothetical protein
MKYPTQPTNTQGKLNLAGAKKKFKQEDDEPPQPIS